MINNRQNGRRRGRGGGQRSQGGGNQGSRDNGNRIDSRARGNASQLYEKYKNMASDAQRQGDRVNTEYYLQFADHYFRVLADQRGRYEDQNRDRRPQNDFDGDDDYGDEGEPIRADEQARGGDDRGEREGGRQYDGNRQHDGNRQYDGSRNSEGRQQEGRQHDGGRYRTDREDGGRSDGARADDGEGRQRDGQQRRQRSNAPRGDQRRDDRLPAEATNDDAFAAAEVPPAIIPQSTPPALAEADAAVPKRRGRPRKATMAEADEQLSLDASALPPPIGGDTTGAEEAAPKPRRRRTVATPVEADA